MHKLVNYEQKLLDAWEDVFKKGQLSLWTLLALKDGPKHMAEIKKFLISTTNETLSVDDQSMYRSLRRYYDSELVTFEVEPGQGGPERKIYRLTTIGLHVLTMFLERNILNVFYRKDVRELIERKISI